MTARGKVLWTPSPSRRDASRLPAFMDLASRRGGRRLDDYGALHRWSVENIPAFWRAVWDFTGVLHSCSPDVVLTGSGMEGARWFPEVRISYAENLLRHAGTRKAVLFESEDEALARSVTFADLRSAVERCAHGLAALGVRPGDRVAAFTPNVPEAVIAMLATSCLGAIWSSTSPDFGPQGVLDRFGQIEPRVLFAADGYLYAGKRHALGDRLRAITQSIPSIAHVVVYRYTGAGVGEVRGLVSWEDLLGPAAPADVAPRAARLPFDHPLAILYTSGTTGAPKCIVHGAGGTLLKHLEEHQLQVDLKENDVFFYFTTCGWMMWNWLTSGLASGAAIVLYDGSPLHPDPGRLFRMIDRLGVSIFGASPRYFAAVDAAGLVPREHFSLGSLRTVLSTGSPLHPAQFEWVYSGVKGDVELASISGGTDIIGCFVGGSPFHAVRAGEIACSVLGMKVQSLDEEGRAVVGEKGDLACAAPFPSMPVGFWNDPDRSKYHAAYFARYPGKWHHGDFIEIHEDGSCVIHGRSDATLNPGGVRIGTAEIYRAAQSVPEVREALAVGRRAGGDERIVLFVVLAAGAILDADLEKRIRAEIRSRASPRHVPAEIHAITEVPRTLSGKPVELAVARVLRGEEVKNLDALANPEALDQFRKFALPG